MWTPSETTKRQWGQIPHMHWLTTMLPMCTLDKDSFSRSVGYAILKHLIKWMSSCSTYGPVCRVFTCTGEYRSRRFCVHAKHAICTRQCTRVTSKIILHLAHPAFARARSRPVLPEQLYKYPEWVIHCISFPSSRQVYWLERIDVHRSKSKTWSRKRTTWLKRSLCKYLLL